MKRWLVAFALAGAAAGWSAPAFAQSDFPRQYTLQDGSQFEIGCFGPCVCPILSMPLQGTFDLRHLGFDGLFDHYAVENVQWVAGANDPLAKVVGRGEYQVGGEFAIEHQMVLDLSVNGGVAQHFDSGRIPGGGEFPKIDVSVSLHQQQQCRDTVFVIKASPAVADVEQGLFGLRPAAPNPFRTETTFLLGLRVAGPVSVGIFDARGRVVKWLASGSWLGPGVYPFTWDGRRSDGVIAPAGFYYLRVTAEGREYRDEVVKLP